MSDPELFALAEAAGLSLRWRDAFGAMHDVAPDALRAVLGGLGLPAGGAAEIAESREELRRQQEGGLPPLVTAVTGQPVRLPGAGIEGRWRLTMEDGETREGAADPGADGTALPAVDVPGYHVLEIGVQQVTLAVAPPRCFTLADAGGGRKLWGLAVQLYALRRPGDGGIGDFAGLREFVRAAGTRGAACVAISPVHAQFSADPDRFSPYAPSSRVMMNVLHGAVGGDMDEAEQRLEAAELIDWPAATRAKMRRLRRAYQAAMEDGALRDALEAFRRELGDVLESHARFEALHGHFFGAGRQGGWNWREWPEEYRSPASAAVAAFAQEHAEEVRFHAFLQFLADRGMAAAQAEARGSGMPIGLIADLAVGTDSGGSHCWARPTETLPRLSVGAPPDLLAKAGQNWGITACSPLGLRQKGFGAFLEMLRAQLRNAGGVRIDHAMGLSRLWVVPEGASAAEGTYLAFPADDLLRLVALESLRHRAVVLGEDLGTLPEGFQEQLEGMGVAGMRVLWFERDARGFTSPDRWSRGAAAMTSTHDLATVAGWWAGGDMDWRAKLGMLRDEAKERGERDADRPLLWQAFRDSGAAAGDPPPPEAGGRVADAAAQHIGISACEFALLPIEDALALPEQPNLPGTLHEHPNWRRRLPRLAATVLDDPAAGARLTALDTARGGTASAGMVGPSAGGVDGTRAGDAAGASTSGAAGASTSGAAGASTSGAAGDSNTTGTSA